MRISWQKILTVVFCACIFCGGLCGCDANPFSQPSVEEATASRLAARTSSLTANDLVSEDTLTIGLVTSSGAPYVLEGKDGYQGIDVNVGAALASELGLKADFVPLSDSASAALTPVDVVVGVSDDTSQAETQDQSQAQTPEQAQTQDQAQTQPQDQAQTQEQTQPQASEQPQDRSQTSTGSSVQNQMVSSDYVEQAVGFFTLGTEPYVASADELSGQTVGLQEDSYSQQLLETSNLVMTQKGYENIDAAMEALKAGEVLFVLCPAYPGAYLAKEMGGICFCGTIDLPTSQGVGVASSSTALAKAVQEAMGDLRENGVLDIILAQWVGDLPQLTSETQVQGIVLADAKSASESPSVAPASGVGDGSTAGGNAVDANSLPGGEESGDSYEGEYDDTGDYNEGDDSSYVYDEQDVSAW